MLHQQQETNTVQGGGHQALVAPQLLQDKAHSPKEGVQSPTLPLHGLWGNGSLAVNGKKRGPGEIPNVSSG